MPAEPGVLQVLEAYRGQVAADEFWKREVQDKAKVSDAEVEAFYEKTDVALGLTLILVTYVPAFSTWLPGLLK